jgi:predicted dehydrogenase
MKVAAGVIGCGNISRFHFDGLEKAGVDVKWVCDLVGANSKPYAERFDARQTKDWMQVVKDPEVNTIVITTLSAIHKSICLAAIEEGKAVICEKTLAETADDSLEIVKAAQAKGTIFYTSYMKRFIPAVETAKRLLPEIGQVISTHIRTHQPWGDLWGGNPAEGFFHTPENGLSMVKKSYGGGILHCGGSHILDLVLFLVGRPSELYANVYMPEDRDYDLRANVLMQTANGSVMLEALAHPLSRIGFLRDGWDERIEITGVQGRLEIYSSLWDNPENKASMLVHYDDRTGQATEYRFDPVSPFSRAVEFFAGNIAAEQQGEQSRVTGYEVDELIESVLLSSCEKRIVKIDWRI